MADLKAFAEQLVNLTVKEVNELAQILKDEYGIHITEIKQTKNATKHSVTNFIYYKPIQEKPQGDN